MWGQETMILVAGTAWSGLTRIQFPLVELDDSSICEFKYPPLVTNHSSKLLSVEDGLISGDLFELSPISSSQVPKSAGKAVSIMSMSENRLTFFTVGYQGNIHSLPFSRKSQHSSNTSKLKKGEKSHD